MSRSTLGSGRVKPQYYNFNLRLHICIALHIDDIMRKSKCNLMR